MKRRPMMISEGVNYSTDTSVLHRSIGKVVVANAQLDEALTWAIHEFVDLGNFMASPLVEGESSGWLSDKLLAVVKYLTEQADVDCFTNDQVQRVKNTNRHIGELLEGRNTIVHGVWVDDWDGDSQRIQPRMWSRKELTDEPVFLCRRYKRHGIWTHRWVTESDVDELADRFLSVKREVESMARDLQATRRVNEFRTPRLT